MNFILLQIYPSEYGLQRLKEEDLKGPPELADTSKNSSEENDGMSLL